MAYAMTKQGSLDNCITYEFICDTIEDMNAIEDRYRTIGTIAIVLSGSSGLEVYIAGSDKQWNSLSTIGGSSGAGSAGLAIHICGQNEVSEGLPNVSEPDETTIYLVPAEDEQSGNLYDEYIYVDGDWEKFGSGNAIDLTGYAPIASPVFTGSISMGRSSNTTVGNNSVAVGENVVASGNYSHAEGYGNSSATKTIGNTTYTGAGAHGAQSHAEGSQTWAIGSSSHAEGGGTTASGTQSHAEGAGSVASGDNSHAEGGGTVASGALSHTEGANTQATNFATHAEGAGSQARGASSHAEGEGTIASGSNSHAEGGGTKASGGNSHAEGGGAIASGDHAHAEGNTTTASGKNSHVEGLETRANHKSQHVFGEHNVSDSSSAQASERGTYVEIVGNGTGASARSNARALDWNGNEYLMGDIYVGCNADSTGGTKVVTEAVLASLINRIAALESKVAYLEGQHVPDAAVTDETGAQITDESSNFITYNN